jgi:hypothetical protein
LKLAIKQGRHSEPDQRTCNRQGLQRRADAKQRAASGGHDQQGRLDAARAEAVDQQAERQLKQTEGEEVGRSQEAQIGRCDAQIAHQIRGDHRVDAAQPIGQKIAGGIGRNRAPQRRRGSFVVAIVANRLRHRTAKSSELRSHLPHEYRHSWNGKFRRPANLGTPNTDTPLRGR